MPKLPYLQKTKNKAKKITKHPTASVLVFYRNLPPTKKQTTFPC
jgi:hypothetical protein